MFYFNKPQYLAAFEDTKLPVVSVGSGMGTVEKYLELNGVDVICVDPSTFDVDPYIGDARVKDADFSHVVSLIKSKPNIVGQNHLLLHFPLPDYALYDIASIYDLKPTYITMVVGYNGKSGSLLLHAFLRSCGIRTIGKVLTEVSLARQGIRLNKVIQEKYQLKKGTSVSRNKEAKMIMFTLERVGEIVPSDSLVSPTTMEQVLIGGDNMIKMYGNCLEFVQSYSVQ
jgi:hypothetical protein